MALDQPFELARRRDIEIVFADGVRQERGVFRHDDGRKVEAPLRDQLRLLGELAGHEADADILEIGVFEQLAHQIGGARSFGPDTDRSAAQLGKGRERAPAFAEQDALTKKNAFAYDAPALSD